MNYYEEIKNKLIENEINIKVKNYSINKSDLNTYYNVGKMLKEAGKHYGQSIIKNYSKKLTFDLGKGYSKRNLWLMLRFYEFREKVQTVSAQLTWSHYCCLFSIDNIEKNSEKINYYIKIVEKQNLSVRQLKEKIKNKEYERLPEETKNKISNIDESSVVYYVIKYYSDEIIILSDSIN